MSHNTPEHSGYRDTITGNPVECPNCGWPLEDCVGNCIFNDKPTTGEPTHEVVKTDTGVRIDPPDPTGEWTADKVLLMGCDEFSAAREIADAHNAALAAAYQKGYDAHYDERIKQGEYGS